MRLDLSFKLACDKTSVTETDIVKFASERIRKNPSYFMNLLPEVACIFTFLDHFVICCRPKKRRVGSEMDVVCHASH